MSLKFKFTNCNRHFTVDDEDAIYVIPYKWCRHKDTGSVVRTDNGTLLCRAILGVTSSTEYVDHISGDREDNRKINLRKSTAAQNMYNRRKLKKGTSRFKGVSWSEKYKKWYACIKINGRSRNLGYFDSEIDAAKAYNEAALRHFGEFAKLNVFEEV